MMRPVVIRERGAVPRGLGRHRPRMQRASWSAAGEYWHARIRNRHFTASGFHEYGYSPRSPRYNARKRRQLGHARPLVKSGLLQRMSRERDVRASRNGGRVVLHIPSYPRNPKSQVNIRAELSAVSKRDAEALAVEFDKEFDRQIDTLSHSENITIPAG